MKYSNFILQVVKFAQDSSNCEAGCEFSVSEKLVRDWRKRVEKLTCMPRNNKPGYQVFQDGRLFIKPFF